jgi:hypothetical protein
MASSQHVVHATTPPPAGALQYMVPPGPPWHLGRPLVHVPAGPFALFTLHAAFVQSMSVQQRCSFPRAQTATQASTPSGPQQTSPEAAQSPCQPQTTFPAAHTGAGGVHSAGVSPGAGVPWHLPSAQSLPEQHVTPLHAEVTGTHFEPPLSVQQICVAGHATPLHERPEVVQRVDAAHVPGWFLTADGWQRTPFPQSAEEQQSRGPVPHAPTSTHLAPLWQHSCGGTDCALQTKSVAPW